MPTYDWFCPKCKLEIDEILPIKEYTGIKSCTKCGKLMNRVYSRCDFYNTGAKVKDAYKCPALGQVIKSDSQRKDLAKKMNVEEIGNEKPETIHKHFDSVRENKLKKSYEGL